MTTHVVCTTKPWNVAAFERRRPLLGGLWHIITDPAQLTAESLRALAPGFVFFPHWSRRVPDEIIREFRCVCFHMTDVPFGRGGSPLQNLIIRGLRETKVSALRMTTELDAGPVYAKEHMSLEGRAQEIFERCAELVLDMAQRITEMNPVPTPQSGVVVKFDRRTAEMSRLPELATDEQLHDFIRMLDADTYPRAFIDHGSWRIEFSHSRTESGVPTAIARFVKRGAR